MVRQIELDQTDFGITIDFAKGRSNPVKVFEALTELLKGFQGFDKVIIGALDPHIESTMLLQDVEANSVTAWIRNRLRQVDDAALKEFDWKKQVGAFAIKAKYKAIEYLDKKEAENENARLQQLRNDIIKLAHQLPLRHIPLTTALDLKQLTEPLDNIQEAKKLLSNEDKIIVKSLDKRHELNLGVTKRPSDFIPEEKIARETSGSMPMILLVRRPDYLGDTRWEFRHGKDTIHAHVLDEAWLERFRSGREIIMPGCALDCVVSYFYGYNATGELKLAKHEVIKVNDVTKGDAPVQDSMFDGH